MPRVKIEHQILFSNARIENFNLILYKYLYCITPNSVSVEVLYSIQCPGNVFENIPFLQ